MKRLTLLGLALAGCMSAKENADTTAQLITDTVKPAPPAESLRTASDTVGRTTSKTVSPATATKTSTATKTIGRDSVIRMDMGAKGRQMGKVFPPDTSRKPPRD